MYQPSAFVADDPQRLREVLLRSPLAQIIVWNGDGFLATPAPLLLNDAGTSFIGHLARPNDVGKHALTVVDGVPCIATFSGVNGYVSPSSYPSKAEHGRVVPTWNYETVHVHGTLRVHTDSDATLNAVRVLTAHFEKDRTVPWADTDSPEDYITNLLRSIVAIEIVVDLIEGKQKFSQNRPEADQQGVLADLQTRGDAAVPLYEVMSTVLNDGPPR
jgi:transcriptional regulator